LAQFDDAAEEDWDEEEQEQDEEEEEHDEEEGMQVVTWVSWS